MDILGHPWLKIHIKFTINSRICEKSIIYLKNIEEDIIKMLEIRGTCVNQISRVTGINRKIIQEVKNGRKW